MSLQPSPTKQIDRKTTTPFLLRLYWRLNQPLTPAEFSVAPPTDTTNIPDYAALLPASLRQQSVQIYTWSSCSLAELTGLLSSVLPEDLKVGAGQGAGVEVGTRLVYKLVFPDTRGAVSVDGRGKWIERPLGFVVVGHSKPEGAQANGRDVDMKAVMDTDALTSTDNANNTGIFPGDAEKTLADARFVIGDYIACAIYPPLADGRPAPLPPPQYHSMGGRGGPREPYVPPRGVPASMGRENEYGYGGGYGGRGRDGGGFGGGFGGGYGAPPPPAGEWRRGERLPGYDGGGGRGGYRGRGGRPY